MSAPKNIKKGEVFGRTDGLSKEEIKELDWMHSVKTTKDKSHANLNLFWEDGKKMYKSLKSIRRGEKLLLFDDSTAGNESEEYNNSDNSNNSNVASNSRSRRRSSRRRSFRSTSVRTTPRKKRGNPKYKDGISDDENGDDSLVVIPAVTKYKENSDEDEGNNSDFDRNSSTEKRNNGQWKRNCNSDPESNSDEDDENSPKKLKLELNNTDDDDTNAIESNDEIMEESESEINKYVCKICSQVFIRKSVLAEHEKKHESQITMYSCELCDRSFVYQRSLRNHLKDDHKGKTLEEIEKRKEKKKNSKQEKKKNGKKSIVNSSISKEKFKCDECSKEFRWKSTYDEHVAIHQKDFVCNICDKVFGRNVYLQNHMTSHKKDGKEEKKNKKKRWDEDGAYSNDEIISNGNSSSGEESLDKTKYRRSERKRKQCSLFDSSDRKKRVARSSRRANINYSMAETSDEDDEGFDVGSKSKKQKRETKIDLSAFNLRKCYVKLEKLSSEIMKVNNCFEDFEEENNEDIHKCNHCGVAYHQERHLINHMEKFHA